MSQLNRNVNLPKYNYFLKIQTQFVFCFSEHYRESLTILENGVTDSRALIMFVSPTPIFHTCICLHFSHFSNSIHRHTHLTTLSFSEAIPMHLHNEVYIILKLVFKKAYIGREYHLLVSFQYNYKYTKFIFVFIFIRRWVKEDLVIYFKK